jgi:DinB family protein
MSNQLETVKTILSTTATRWLGLTENVPVDLLTRTPAPNEWSALDCLCHLLDAEQWVFPVRVQALLSGQNMAAFDPDTQGTQYTTRNPKQLAEEFARRRKVSLAELEQATTQDLARTAQHSELGIVTLGELLNEWAAHDLMHTVQAERALMQPFILGSGPWRPYFQDHDVSK